MLRKAATNGDVVIIGGAANSEAINTGVAYVFELGQFKPTPTITPTYTPTYTPTRTMPTPSLTLTPIPGGPEMTLDVTAGGSCAGEDCYARVGSNFKLTVSLKNAPPAGYVLMQTFLDYGYGLYDPTASEDGAGPNTCDDGVDNNGDGKLDRDDIDCVTLEFAYIPAVVPADEIVWPDLNPAIALRREPRPGYLFHGGLTGLFEPLPVSSHEGALVTVEFSCPSWETAAPISLLPYSAPNVGTSGSLVEGHDGRVEQIVKVNTITIHCIEPTAGDYDGDGCDDARENGSNPALGGDRSFVNPWDFYDVAGPGGTDVPDGVIDLPNDLLQMVAHYSPHGGPPYDVRYDRGKFGANSWTDTQPPDGVIDLPNDLLGLIQQLGHSCA